MALLFNRCPDTAVWSQFFFLTVVLLSASSNGFEKHRALEASDTSLLTTSASGSTVLVAAPALVALASSTEAQARLLDAILNTSGALIFVLAPDGQYLYVSATAARAMGLPREEIVGRSDEALGVPPALAAWMTRKRTQVLTTGEHLTGDFRFPNVGCETRDYQYQFSPLLSASGVAEAVICTASDVTEQRHAEAEAAAAGARSAAAYQRNQDIAATLQRSLLQLPLPDAFPGLEIVSRYESATADMEVGGDYLDVFLLDRSRVALVVGDVAGKGLPAAARIAEAKFTLRGFLREYASCPIGLTRLNGYLCDTSLWEGQLREEFVCLSLAIFDTATGDLTVSVAGEEAPLLVRANGLLEILPVQGMPLGVMPQTEYWAAATRMNIGDTLVLVTDGIIEARRAGAQLGMDGLCHLIASAGTDSSAAAQATRIMAGAKTFGGGVLSDDAAILLARRVS